MVDVIRLQPKQLTITEKRAKLPLPLRFITSPKLTAVLADTLGALTGGALLGAKAFFGTGLVGGILETSPIVRKQAKEKILDPTKIGRGLGKLIEDPSKLLPKEKGKPLERAKEIAKTAGLIGGAAAVGTAAVVVGAKKIKEVIAKVPSIPKALIPSRAPKAPIQEISKLPEAVTPSFEVIPGEIKPEVPKPAPIKAVAPIMPSIKNVFKPSINIKVSQKRKFINQQVLVKA